MFATPQDYKLWIYTSTNATITILDVYKNTPCIICWHIP